MIKSRIAVAGALLAVAGAASAGSFSATPTIVSDYDWRGFTQTDEDPAFQLDLNYSFDSGFYIGAWGSNVDFGPGDPDVEVDLYAGYGWGDSEEGLGYDVGVNTYNYPGLSSANFWEAYFGVSHGMFSGKLWYSPKYFGDGGEDAFYLQGDVTVPLQSGFSLLGHLGYSIGDGFKQYFGENELDYSAGVGYDISNFSFAVKYTDTAAAGFDGRVIASVSTTLPWGE